MKTLPEIYALIPDVECKGLCQEACGPISMTEIEAQAIRDRVGASARIVGGLLVGKSLTCPLLNPDGRCAVYEQRPAICRIWGAVKEMACPHGCKPKRWMTKAESYQVLSQIGKFAEIPRDLNEI